MLVTPTHAPARWAGGAIAGADATVVLLHSSLSSKSQWTALVERLAPRFRVIALDLWGYGDNAMPPARVSFTLDDEVRLVAGHLDHVEKVHVRVHLVGHSYGGLVALRFAQRFGDRVPSLSLYEPVAFRVLRRDDATLTQVKALAERVRALLAADHRPDAARAFVDFWSGDGSYESLHDRGRARIVRNIDKLPLDFQAASWSRPSANDLRTIATPTLLLCGHRSPRVVHRIIAMLDEGLPDSRVASFDAGHMGPVTDPHLVNPWIEAFVDAYSDAGDASPPRRAAGTPAAWQSAAD